MSGKKRKLKGSASENHETGNLLNEEQSQEYKDLRAIYLEADYRRCARVSARSKGSYKALYKLITELE
jgi:hypothetical protein